MTYDAATIAAFVDGELDDVAAKRIARAAEGDADLATEIARHKALKNRLAAHYAPVLDERVPDRFTALLAGTAKVDTSFADRLAEKQQVIKPRPRFSSAHWGAMAASLALGLTIGLGPLSPDGPVATEKGALIASGSLAKALDTQLASNQLVDSSIRIGLSFKSKDGRYCRTFDGSALAGIGCHNDGVWQLEQTMSGTKQSDYRQASSGALASAAADMMAEAPLDAAGEAAAKASGWTKTAMPDHIGSPKRAQ